MQERRQSQRKNLMAYNQVFDSDSGHLLGYLADLHLQGAMVIGERFVERNAEIMLAIELPELPDVAAPRVTIPARAVWCQQDISPKFYNIGFEFKKVTREQAVLLKAIIKNYEFRRPVPPGGENPLMPG